MAASPARWLVTGAGGQLGLSLLATGRAAGIEAHGRDHAGLDICDAAALARALDAVRPEVVVNAAAFTQVDQCETEGRGLAQSVNARAPALLAEACRGRALLVHVSTDFVFGGDAVRPIPEDAPLAPRSVYGETKAAGEQAVRASGCEHLIVRCQWLYGEGRNFVRTILAAAARGEPLRVVEDQLGRPTATGPLAARILGAVERGQRGTLHLACEGVASWYDFARAIVREGARRGLTKEVEVLACPSHAVPRPAVRPAYAVLGLERARAAGLALPHWTDALTAYLDEELERHA
jgi:dTDP-4-dehydrorhamnose reductase